MRIKSSLLAATMLVLASAAQAQIYIVPNGGVADTAAFENQSAGGPGFPLNLLGYQHDAALYVSTTNTYRFTYLGSGDSTDTNSFTVGSNSFISYGVGGLGAGSTAVGSFFDVELMAGTSIPFTYTNLTTGCTMSNGQGVATQEDCHYLLALTDSPGPIPATDPQWAAYIGWSDRPSDDLPVHTGDHDFQDLSVRVEVVPEPASMALLVAGLLGLGVARRRRG